MSDDLVKEPPEEGKEPPSLRGDVWREWYREVRVGVADMAAVAEDQLQKKRERDLGVREATRLFNDARDKLARLFAHAEGRGGSPAD
jgi:hypothetical protein